MVNRSEPTHEYSEEDAGRSDITLTEMDGTPLTVNFNSLVGRSPVNLPATGLYVDFQTLVGQFNQSRQNKPELKIVHGLFLVDNDTVKEKTLFGRSVEIPNEFYYPEYPEPFDLRGTKLDLGNRQTIVLQTMEEISDALKTGNTDLHGIGRGRVNQRQEHLNERFTALLRANFD